MIKGFVFVAALVDGVLPPRGNAAWVYDVKGGAVAMWADQIGDFNSACKDCAVINTVFSYGGDMEWYPDLNPPGQTYFAQQSQEAASTYGGLRGIEHVVAVVDGRMDGGQTWKKNLETRKV